MEMNHDAPGNISQKGVNSQADNETGFDPRSRDQVGPDEVLQPSAEAGEKEGVDDELGFDPDSPDLADPQIDPPHPARTSNDPVPSQRRPENGDEPAKGGQVI